MALSSKKLRGGESLGYRELLITIAVIAVAFVLGGASPIRISELTPGELVIVVLVSLVLAIGAFVLTLRWVEDISHYVPALVAAAVVSLFLAEAVVNRVRGPACLSDEINDPSLCKPPPSGVMDQNAWWQGWAAAESVMIVSGCAGAAVGSLVKLEIRNARPRSRAPR